MLDIACGSGYAAALAARRGAEVAGVDIAPALLEIARERTLEGSFLEGEMDALPLPDSRFDVATAVNGFQFALDPPKAFAEAARVLVPGGRLAAATFAEPERNEGTALHLAMKRWSADGGYAVALSSPGGLDSIPVRLVQARSRRLASGHRHDRPGLLASAGGRRAASPANRVRERSSQRSNSPTLARSRSDVFRYVVGVKG